MRFYKIIALTAQFSGLSIASQGQGCSDAGVCSLNAFKPAGETAAYANHLKQWLG